MKTTVILVATGRHEAVYDITRECEKFTREAGGDGIFHVFVPQATGGVAGHGRSHVMPALIPPYATFPVIGGRMALGTWQSVALVDLNVDNPDRQVRLSMVRGD